MKDFIQPILDFLFKLADKYGTKFLVALGAIGGVGYLGYTDKLDGWIAAVLIAVICLGYFFARRKQETETALTKAQENGNETVTGTVVTGRVDPADNGSGAN